MQKLCKKIAKICTLPILLELFSLLIVGIAYLPFSGDRSTSTWLSGIY